MNVDLAGTHVAICFGYPPNAVFRQSIYTALYGQGGLLSKIKVEEETLATLLSEARATGLFKPAGRELKWVIDRSITSEEIGAVLGLLRRVVLTVKERGLQT